MNGIPAGRQMFVENEEFKQPLEENSFTTKLEFKQVLRKINHRLIRKAVC